MGIQENRFKLPQPFQDSLYSRRNTPQSHRIVPKLASRVLAALVRFFYYEFICNTTASRSSCVADTFNTITSQVQHGIFEILESKGLFRSQFEPFYMGREEWALILQCDRTTLWRYERQIIRLVFPILKEYEISKFLDNYQRCILALIYAQKQGWIDGKKREYPEIKDWLKRSRSQLTREQFNNWINNA